MAPIVTKLMAFDLQALDQRKKDLSKLEKRTGEMVDAGSEFADLADQLLQKYKRWQEIKIQFSNLHYTFF